MMVETEKYVQKQCLCFVFFIFCVFDFFFGQCHSEKNDCFIFVNI